jgi:hypothetical protein
MVFPDSLGPHGSFLKARLSLFPPLLWLAIIRLPSKDGFLWGARGLIFLLLGINLFQVFFYFDQANRKIQKYTAQVDKIGSNRTLFVAWPYCRGPTVDLTEHAADYYCLDSGNINLDNYEASTLHFPVRYRPGFSRARGYFEIYPRRESVNVILTWEGRPNNPETPSFPFQTLFLNDHLTVWGRKP